MTYHPKEVLTKQVPEEHGAMINGEQVNDPTKEDDHTDNVVEDYGDRIINSPLVKCLLD